MKPDGRKKSMAGDHGRFCVAFLRPQLDRFVGAPVQLGWYWAEAEPGRRFGGPYVTSEKAFYEARLVMGSEADEQNG